MKKNVWTSKPFSPAILALAILFTSASGFAQDAPDLDKKTEQTQQKEPTQDAQTQAEQAKVLPLAPTEDPAWQLYQQAFVETLRGHKDAAESLLNQLITEYPQHEAVPLAQRALAVMLLVQADQPTIEQPGIKPVAGDSVAIKDPSDSKDSKGSKERTLSNGETTNAQARAELVIFQTLHGIGVGMEICIIAGCDDPRPVFAALTGGAAVGLAGSLYFSRNGITAGQASTYNSGTVWGLWNGLALSNALELEGKAITGSMLAGQAVGLGGAALAWHLFEPTAGTVSLVNSGQIWATVITTLVHGTTGFKAESPLLWGSLIAASNAGLVAGALLSQEFPMSRGRALVIDSGGVLGALVGFSAYVLIAGNDNLNNGEAAMGSGLAGTVLGLGAATYFSRNWDDADDTSAQLFINPTDGGAIVGFAGNF